MLCKTYSVQTVTLIPSSCEISSYAYQACKKVVHEEMLYRHGIMNGITYGILISWPVWFHLHEIFHSSGESMSDRTQKDWVGPKLLSQ